jgi:hypothetical protein
MDYRLGRKQNFDSLTLARLGDKRFVAKTLATLISALMTQNIRSWSHNTLKIAGEIQKSR